MSTDTEKLRNIRRIASGMKGRAAYISPEHERQRRRLYTSRLKLHPLNKTERMIVKKLENADPITAKDIERLKNCPNLRDLRMRIQNSRKYFEIGKLNFELKKYDEAADYFLKARDVRINLPEHNAESLYMQITCNTKSIEDNTHGGKVSSDVQYGMRRLLKTSQTLVEEYPSNGNYWALRGDLMVLCLDMNESDNTERELIDIKPSNAIQLYLKALKLGISAINKKKNKIKKGRLFHSLGELYLTQDDPKNASKYFKKMILIDKTDPDPYSHLVMIASNEKKYEKALKYSSIVYDLDPTPSTAYNLGVSYAELEKFQKALQYFEIALKGRENPKFKDQPGMVKFSQIQKSKYITFKKLDKNEEALHCLNKILLDEPRNIEVIDMKAQLEEHMGNNMCALATNELLIEIQGKTTRNLSNKTIILVHLNRIDAALECIEESLKIDPEHMDSLHMKFNILKDAKKFKEAEKTIDKCIALDDSMHNNFHKVEILLTEGLHTENLEKIRAALKVQNKNIKKFKINLKSNLMHCKVRVDILAKLGKHDECLKLLKIIETAEKGSRASPDLNQIDMEYSTTRMNVETTEELTIGIKILSLMDLKKFKEIEKIYDNYHSPDPSGLFMFQSAIFYDFIGKFDQAINALAFAFVKNPTLKNNSHKFSKKLMADKRFKLLRAKYGKK